MDWASDFKKLRYGEQNWITEWFIGYHWCQLKKKDLIFKKEERRLQRGKKAKIG